MANVVHYNTDTGAVLGYMKSVNTTLYLDKKGYLINPIMPQDVPLKYLKVISETVFDSTEKEKAEIEAKEKLDNYAELRARDYPPIGEQLDAILKHLNYMQMRGETNLITELDGIVGRWLQVKQQYPKPEDK